VCCPGNRGEGKRQRDRLDAPRQDATLRPMQHSPGFLKLVAEAQSRIHEVTVAEARAALVRNPHAVLLDVREDREWQQSHANEAVHLGKGVLERDLERLFPDPQTELLMYCGGGFRSALTCDAAQRLGYRNVHSLIGGHKAMVVADWPMRSGD
jgi:rhodanese-related sulfurtransferase